MNASQLPGRVFSSVLADHVRSRYLHITALLMTALIVPPFWLRLSVTHHQHGSLSLAAVYTFTIIYGLLHGSIVALTATDIQELLKHIPNAGQRQSSDRTRAKNNYGQLSGVVYTAAAPFILGGPLVTGRLVDMSDIRVVGIWAAACFAIAATLMGVSLCIGAPEMVSSRMVGSPEGRLRHDAPAEHVRRAEERCLRRQDGC